MALRVKNIQGGYMVGGHFHPIRASSDYDPDRKSVRPKTYGEPVDDYGSRSDNKGFVRSAASLARKAKAAAALRAKRKRSKGRKTATKRKTTTKRAVKRAAPKRKAATKRAAPKRAAPKRRKNPSLKSLIPSTRWVTAKVKMVGKEIKMILPR